MYFHSAESPVFSRRCHETPRAWSKANKASALAPNELPTERGAVGEPAALAAGRGLVNPAANAAGSPGAGCGGLGVVLAPSAGPRPVAEELPSPLPMRRSRVGSSGWNAPPARAALLVAELGTGSTGTLVRGMPVVAAASAPRADVAPATGSVRNGIDGPPPASGSSLLDRPSPAQPALSSRADISNATRAEVRFLRFSHELGILTRLPRRLNCSNLLRPCESPFQW